MGTAKGLTVSAIANCMRILTLLDEQPSGLRVRDTGEKLDISKSSVSRLFLEMVNAGFLEKRPDATFIAGRRLMSLGERSPIHHPRLADAREAMGELIGRFGFTGYVSRLTGGQNLVLNVTKGAHSVHAIGRLHERRPALDTAGGLAVLSHLGEADLVRLVGANIPSAEFAALTENLETIKRRQFVYKASTRMDGWTSVAAVLPQPGEGNELSLCIAWPDSAVDTHLMAQMSEHLLRQVEMLRALD